MSCNLPWRSALTVAVLLSVPGVVGAETVEVTFLGNEGFLLVAGEHKVLVDALVDRTHPTYVHQTEELRESLAQARPPFDGVDLVLATHVHGDHFGPEAVGRHLTANPGAHFVSTPQSVKRLTDVFAGADAIRDRVRAELPDEGRALSIPELGLTVLQLHHGRDRDPPIENLGFVIDAGELSFLHMGDTEVSATELASAGLEDRAIDVAFVPSWYLDARPWKGAIDQTLNPREIVVMHLAPNWAHEKRTSNQRESGLRVPRIREAYPEAIVFDAPLQSRKFRAARPAVREPSSSAGDRETLQR